MSHHQPFAADCLTVQAGDGPRDFLRSQFHRPEIRFRDRHGRVAHVVPVDQHRIDEYGPCLIFIDEWSTDVLRIARVPYDRTRNRTVFEACRMTTSIVSLSEFKAKAAQMLSEMKAAEHPIIITQRGAASAVVHDYRVHQRLQNALLMLKLMVQGEADVARGRTIAQERVFADLKLRLTAPTDG